MLKCFRKEWMVGLQLLGLELPDITARELQGFWSSKTGPGKENANGPYITRCSHSSSPSLPGQRRESRSIPGPCMASGFEDCDCCGAEQYESSCWSLLSEVPAVELDLKEEASRGRQK